MQAEQDYTRLRDALQVGEFQKADDETRALLIKLAGPEAEKRGWVYFTEVRPSHLFSESEGKDLRPSITGFYIVLATWSCCASDECQHAVSNLQVKFIPEVDLQTMDNLWRASSGNKFGYSVQKDLWIQNRRRWDKFFQAIDWVQGENNVYRSVLARLLWLA